MSNSSSPYFILHRRSLDWITTCIWWCVFCFCCQATSMDTQTQYSAHLVELQTSDSEPYHISCWRKLKLVLMEGIHNLWSREFVGWFSIYAHHDFSQRKLSCDGDRQGMQLSSPGFPGLFAPRRCTERRLCHHKFATLCIWYVKYQFPKTMQRVQNAAARIVCQASRRQHHSVGLLKRISIGYLCAA